ncbi:hypothetical protein HZS_2184 [Henneguya salminicola]|nr:hypothetical protein HZS_2184 [Henneguya salminicola]
MIIYAILSKKPENSMIFNNICGRKMKNYNKNAIAKSFKLVLFRLFPNMAKRVQFNDDVVEHIFEHRDVEDGGSETHKKIVRRKLLKEEDENEDQLIQRLGKRVLDINEIEGQEAATETGYGDIKITPFNLEEECEEGHFDQSGNFIFDKEDTETRDTWLDTIEWSEIKDTQIVARAPLDEVTINKEEFIKNIISTLDENDTVLDSLKKLNRKRKDCGNNVHVQDITKTIIDLTEWADALMAHGDLNIYQRTGNELREQISHTQTNKNEMYWFYKWDTDSQEYGPFTTQQLIDWKNSGFFKTFVLCRKSDSSEYQRSDSLFYVHL